MITHTTTQFRNVGLTQQLLLLAAALLCGLIWTSATQARQSIAGIWYDDTGKGAVELFPCRRNICGRIVWLKQPLSKSGGPLRDAYNPSPQQRNRPICGLQIIANARPQSDGTWDSGRIYDPKVGRTYDVAIEKLSARQIRITGYLGAKLFGKSFIWRRAPAGLKLCATQ